MLETTQLLDFMKNAVGGVTKTQLERAFKERNGWTDEEVKNAIKLCNFKQKPSHIDYEEFYNAPITKKCNRLSYPFTQIYTLDNFLDDETCDELLKTIESNLYPSVVTSPNDDRVISDYRTSKTANLEYTDNPFYFALDKKLSDFIGLNPLLGEIMQAQKYEIGQYYKEHWDFFSPLTKEFKVYCEWMGQRTWTTMIYLNDVEKGGETYFKHLKLRIKPKKGMLVAWNNLYKNGLPNFKTMHEACPPVSGSKYVITKWWRSWTLI